MYNAEMDRTQKEETMDIICDITSLSNESDVRTQ